MSKKLSRRDYQLCFVQLVCCLRDEIITINEYKELLHKLLQSYRKDYKNGSKT